MKALAAVVNFGAKYVFAVAAAGFVIAAGYQIAVGERAGTVLLFGVGITGLLMALAIQGAVGADLPPVVPAAAEAPELVPVVADGPGPSPWPLVGGLSAGGVVVGAAAGSDWLAVAIAATALPFIGWLTQTWRGHGAFTPRVRRRVDDRLVAPILLPVGALAVALFIAAGMSRLLLAVSKDVAWPIAIVAAVGILLVLAYLAAKPSLRPTTLSVAGVAGALIVVASGIVGASAGERTFHPHEDPVYTEQFVAKEVQFNKNRLRLPAHSEARIVFRNLDEGTFHNVAFYTSEQNGEPIFNGRPIDTGEIDYHIDRTPDVGTYFFVCDFHPNMKGDLVVSSAVAPGETGHERDHAE